MRQRWWQLKEGARWAIAVSVLAALVVAWGAIDQIALERYHDQRQAHAITQDEYDKLSVGDPQSPLLARFGEPEDDSLLEPDEESCVTYKEEGAALLRERTYRLCFEDGRLTYKDFAPIEDPDLLTEGAVLESR